MVAIFADYEEEKITDWVRRHAGVIAVVQKDGSVDIIQDRFRACHKDKYDSLEDACPVFARCADSRKDRTISFGQIECPRCGQVL